jgi:hypothetical protein
MADDECDTFLLKCEKICQIFRENLNNSKIISRDIKANLLVCMEDFEAIIKEQDNEINRQKNYIIDELKVNIGRHCM